MVLNSAGGSQVSLPATTAWTTVSAGQVLLNAGSNTIQIQSNWGYYLIDAITLAPKGQRAPHKITTTPVNANANADAKALLKYLGSIYGKKILSGQQDQASLDWVTTNIGKTPAILGLDLMDYTDSRTSRGASSKDIDHAIAFAQKGGIVTIVWHWGAPVGLYDTAAQPWYATTSTRELTSSINSRSEWRLHGQKILKQDSGNRNADRHLHIQTPGIPLPNPIEDVPMPALCCRRGGLLCGLTLRRCLWTWSAEDLNAS